MGAGGQGCPAPAHVPADATTGATNKFAQLCRADVGKVRAFLVGLAGEGKEEREKGHGGNQHWKDVHRNPATTHQGCLRQIR